MNDAQKTAVILIAVCSATAGYCFAEARRLKNEANRSKKKAEAMRDMRDEAVKMQEDDNVDILALFDRLGDIAMM